MSDEFDTKVVASFAPEHYEQILAMMCDCALLPSRYAAWRRGFEEHIVELHRRAVTPVVVEVDPDAFWAWCMAEDWPCDAQARMEYAEWLADIGRAPRDSQAGRLRLAPATTTSDRSSDRLAVLDEPPHEAAA